jgi:hypothetical protein
MNFKSVNPSNPFNFGATTPGEMAGIGVTFSMVSRPEMMIIIAGDLGVGSSGEVTLSLRYGTGTPPTNGSAGTGTEISKIIPEFASSISIVPFTLQGIVSGLSVGTTYWIDICGIDDSSVNINNLDVSIVELAGAIGATGSNGTSGTSGTSAPATAGTVNVVIDGSGSLIPTGVKGDLYWNFAATITGWTILADQTGAIVVDVWKDTYANYPPTVADTIAGTEKPTLVASSVKNQDLSLTSFSTAVTAGDIWRFNVDSSTSVTRVTISFNYTRT